ncbi:hypothetical protein [Microbacterium sp. GXF7504]
MAAPSAPASAVEWARDVSLAADLRLARVEIVAFRRRPEIFRHFGSDGAAAARSSAARDRSPAARAGAGIVVVLAVIGLLAPIAAVTAMGGDRFNFFRMDASDSVPLAGALFIVTAVTQLIVLILWLRRGARFDGFVLGVVLVGAVFSGLGLIGMPNAGVYDGYDGWTAWYPAVIAAFAIPAVTTVALIARRRHRVPETVAEPAAPTGGGPDAIRAAIAALPPAERDSILADRDAALAVLAERGILDPARYAAARDTELGMLYRLDPPID